MYDAENLNSKKKRDKELSEKPMKRFLMANEHDPNRIERLLFKDVVQEEA